jgi:hypothetical protein
MMRALTITLASIAGGVISALVFAATIDPNVGTRALGLPAVLPIATVCGAAVGVLLSPLAIWALWHGSLMRTLPLLFVPTLACIIVLNLCSVGFSEWLSLAVACLIMLLLGVRSEVRGSLVRK